MIQSGRRSLRITSRVQTNEQPTASRDSYKHKRKDLMRPWTLVLARSSRSQVHETFVGRGDV